MMNIRLNATYSLLLAAFSLLLLILVPGCEDSDTHPEIPDVPVSFVINPNSTEYLELNHVGGSVYLTGGYNGILVYRADMNTFMAYDRACPYDFDTPHARIELEASGITCVCPVCQSKYIITDGTPFEGPSRYMLKQYITTYDGSLLYVYN
jgi:nitrite reductase/ring-hydroxylating ferredoxin subunit